MAELDIVLYPDPILKELCAEVTTFNSELEKLLDDMAETMYASKGIGLAAPQIGVKKRIAVVDVSDSKKGLIEIINPKLIKTTGKVESEEGCLSIPEYRDVVERHEEIVIEAQDRTGKIFTLEANEILAICIQHEIDHLDGILFIDYLSQLKRKMFKNWYRKNTQEKLS